MKLFVGLWNPWVQYEKTRHNAWFIALTEFCDRHNATDFLYNKKFHAEVATWLFEWVQFIAVKPLTFMNNSWQSVQAIMQFYKIASQDCLVFQDDIDLPSWALKLKYGWSHGWQNWIRDMIAKTGSAQFRRLKFGIWRPTNSSYDIADYVLSKFSDEEMHALLTLNHDIDQRVLQYCKNTGK